MVAGMHISFFAIGLLTRPSLCRELTTATQACDTEGTDEVCAHTSLLQTSVTFETKQASVSTEHRVLTPKQARKSQHQRHRSGHERAKASFAHFATLKSAHGSREDAQSHTMLFLGAAVLIVIIIALFAFLRQDPPAAPPAMAKIDDEDVEARIPTPCEDDVFMMSVALISRDWQALAKGVANPGLPLYRMAFSVVLLVTTITMQMMLLWGTKAFVTPQAVASIRDSYDKYEQHMYSNHTRVLEATGKHRGLPGYFNASLFDQLEDETKGEVCQIPFSQLNFLALILVIWTVTCVSQIASCFQLGYGLLVALPTISSMADSMVHENVGKPRRKRTIVGLTSAAKLSILVLILIPWLGCTAYLTWLGCRWLAATNCFGDLVANGMALEFILQFKTLFYYAVASERTKRDVACTRYAPPAKKENISFLSYFNSVLWGFVSVAWVYLYIFHFQQVLPEYQWDVHAPCTPYLMGALKPSSQDQ
jgi:hypothetical protein